jgi:hypothetical protein
MDFLAPLMLLGVLGVAVPVAIHLFGRRRAPVRRFGAIDFLLGTDRKVARRLKVREALLMALRAAACLALALALAKPLVSCAGTGPGVARGPQAVVLVIDNSFTMGYRVGAETLLTRAKAAARRTLEDVGPEAEVAILFSAEGAEPPLELSRDHLKLDGLLKEAHVEARPADTTAALRRAAALLAGSSYRARRVYLFSALAATGFPAGDPPWPPGSGPELHVHDVAEGSSLANVAVTAVHAEKEPDLGARGVRVTAEIANYGKQPVTGVGVTLRVGTRAVARGLISLGPGEGASKRFSVPLPGDARAAEATVEIDGDALSADDRRHLRLELRSEVRVLVVDGDPRTVRHDDETFYLETALRPGDRADSALSVSSATPDELPSLRLPDYDVIFLCNVKALPDAPVRALGDWLQKGGGLFISVGDNVDADAYDAQMLPLLPQELKSPQTLAPPGATPKERDDLAERLAAKFEAGHPIFSVFGAAGVQALRAARFHRIFLLGPTTRGEGRRVLARYQSGAPALVEGRAGKGRVLLWTSSIDRDWTDLPIHQAYLPLVQQATRYLARSPTRDVPAEVLVGRVHDLPVGPEDVHVEVTSPSGRKTTYEGERVRGRTSVPFAATVEPGFYHVAAQTSAEALRPRSGADFVVNLDPRGSDVRRIEASDLPVGGSAVASTGASDSPAPRRRIELWHGLAAMLLMLLLAEGLLTRR